MNKYEKMIAKNNEAFKKANAAEKRVLIAKDALALIAEKKLIPQSGVYVWSGPKFRGMIERKGTQKALQQMPEPCKVCGIGALFVSQVRYDDHFEAATWGSGLHISAATRSSNPERDGNEMMRFKLAKFFPQQQQIEASFEGANDYRRKRGILNNRAWPVPAEDERALVSILKNIIRNKGRFIMSDLREGLR